MDLQIFRDTLRKKLQEHKLTLNSLSAKADLSEDTLRSLIYGKSQDIKLSTLMKIADVLECPLDELMNRDIYSIQEKELIERMRILPKRSVRFVHFILELEEKSALIRSKDGLDTVPVFIPTGNARDGMFYDTSRFERLDITNYPSILKQAADFGIRVQTRSYEPIYFPNDILLFSKQQVPRYYDTVLYVNNDGRLFLRRYSESGLEPVNEFGPLIPTSDLTEYSALGTILKVVKHLDIEQYR